MKMYIFQHFKLFIRFTSTKICTMIKLTKKQLEPKHQACASRACVSKIVVKNNNLEYKMSELIYINQELGEVKYLYGSGPRAHGFFLAHDTFCHFPMPLFLFLIAKRATVLEGILCLLHFLLRTIKDSDTLDYLQQNVVMEQ